jgi:hypothetical protein
MQSRAVFTIRGHLERQANSNGKKYLSASKMPALEFGTGKAEDDALSELQLSICTEDKNQRSHFKKTD